MLRLLAGKEARVIPSGLLMGLVKHKEAFWERSLWHDIVSGVWRTVSMQAEIGPYQHWYKDYFHIR